MTGWAVMLAWMFASELLAFAVVVAAVVVPAERDRRDLEAQLGRTDGRLHPVPGPCGHVSAAGRDEEPRPRGGWRVAVCRACGAYWTVG